MSDPPIPGCNCGCSTPGGIGAAITRPASPPARSRGRVLNARRHRGGDHYRVTSDSASSRSAQRPEASGRRSRRGPHGEGAVRMVLNARRHRGGDHSVGGSSSLKRRAKCSTPGGIGAAITQYVLVDLGGPPPVLNARRHRGGDHPTGSGHLRHSTLVLNARRHRGGDHHGRGTCHRTHSQGAQRPEASGRRSRSRQPRAGPRRGGAQRPEASGRRSPAGEVPGPVVGYECSTPGGIGAAITIAAPLIPRRRRGAQRPEASGRRSLGSLALARSTVSACSTPGGIGAAITRVDPAVGTDVLVVLNARRHRGGDHFKGQMCCTDGNRMCSTPGGIGAAITSPPSIIRPKWCVLNARRHRGGDHPGRRSARAARARAQRPEASGRRSLPQRGRHATR